MPVRHQDQTRRARRPVPAPGRADVPGVVVLLTGDEELASAVARLAAAAGADLRRTGATDGDEVRLRNAVASG